MPNGTLTYHVEGMRVGFPEGKVADKNPDRFATVYGKFFSVDAKGKVSTEPLSISQKNITTEEGSNPQTVIDLATGTLTIPEGRRGRQKSEGATQETLAERLAALRANT